MASKVLRKLTLQNLKAHRKTGTAFVLASSVFMSLIYIVFSLINNQYVQTRHEVLPTIMTFAAIVLVVLSLVFMLYANNFIMKQRYKEFGLYSVLGLEKKHIRRIVFREMVVKFLTIAAVSIPAGYLFGSLCFMLVNKLMKDTSIGFFAYPFDGFAAIVTLSVLFAIMLLAFLISLLRIGLSNPLELMKTSSKGEKEPRSNLFVLILGLFALSAGYYIAFTTEGVIDSIFSIFQAVILVIIGTYLLFNSLSIFILKCLKRNKAYYYKAQNFLSISGMLYRMKANATSLASIAILSTGIMVVLGMTFTSYLSMEDIVNTGMTADYEISYSGEEKLDSVISEMKKHVEVKKVSPFEFTIIGFELSDGALLELSKDSSRKDVGMATVMTLKDYNSAYGETLSMNNHQLGFSSNAARWNDFSELKLLGNEYDVIQLKQKPDAKIAIDYGILVLPETIGYEEIIRSFPNYLHDRIEYQTVSSVANIEAEGDHQAVYEAINDIAERYEVTIHSKEEMKRDIYQMNGGLLFLGLIVGMILLVGAFLMIYFKQMSEGYEDVGNFNIMKQVGLEDRLIRKTINAQIKWIFILPVLVATIHSLAASKIVFNSLGLIGVRDYNLFITNYLLVIAVFSAAYGVMYRITSKLYYRIVNGDKTVQAGLAAATQNQ